ncbi:hypothetical protein D3C87_126630 [compost metagenome]
MNTKCKTRLSLNFLFLTLSFYGQNSPAVKHDSFTNPIVLKEYVLLFRYPNIVYTQQQLEDLKLQWSITIAGWKNKGAYISNQVLEPKGILITGKNAKIKENTFAEGDMFLGATITLLAQSKELAIELAKESPVLSIGGNIEIREPRYIDKSKRVTLIDTFTIPQSLYEVFIERMSRTKDMLKKMLGFIEDHTYEKTSEESHLSYITITTWENEESLAQAKKAMASLYKKENFNLQEFIEKNGIIMQRTIYKEMKK